MEKPRLLTRLKGGQYRTMVLRSSGGTVLGQIILVAATPALTRIYSPADFGALAVFTAILSVLLVQVSLRYDAAIPIPKDEQEAAEIFVLSAVVTVAVSLVSVPVAFFTRDWVSRISGIAVLRDYWWLFPASLLLGGLYQVFNMWGIRKGNFSAIARTRVTQSVWQVGLALALGSVFKDPVGLLSGYAAGRTGGASALLKMTVLEDKPLFRRVKMSSLPAVAHRYRRFPLMGTLSSVLNNVSIQFPALLIAIFFGPVTAGYYNVSQRVLSVPLNISSSSVYQVFWSESARMFRTDPAGLPRLFWRTLTKMCLIGLPGSVLIVLGTQYAIVPILGEKWQPAGVFIQSMTLMTLTGFVASCLGGVLDVLQRQDLLVVRDLSRSVVLCGSLFAAHALGMTPANSMWLFGAAGSFGYLIYIFTSWYAIHRYLRPVPT